MSACRHDRSLRLRYRPRFSMKKFVYYWSAYSILVVAMLVSRIFLQNEHTIRQQPAVKIVQIDKTYYIEVSLPR